MSDSLWPEGAADAVASNGEDDGARAGKAEGASGVIFRQDGAAVGAPVLAYRIDPPEPAPRADPALAQAIPGDICAPDLLSEALINLP